MKNLKKAGTLTYAESQQEPCSFHEITLGFFENFIGALGIDYGFKEGILK
jgi:hypothetical protein